MARQLFNAWLPDQPAHLNDGVTQADGVFAIAAGYAPVRSFMALPGPALPSTIKGGAAYRVQGNTYSFVADADTLRLYSGGAYTTLASGLANILGVRFVPYSTLMLATNGTDAIKKFDPSTGTVNNLGGSPPIARFVAVVGGFVVLGYASGSPLRLAWSNQDNPEQWTPSTASEAGVADMATGGDITGLVGGEYGLVLQENRIVRMTYTASDTVWQFDQIAMDIGCILPGSVATWGTQTFFLSNRGFMRCDGSSVTPIGAEKVDRWFQAQANRQYYDNVSAIIDPINSLYIVTVPSAAPANTLLIYNFVLDRWTTARLSVDRLVSGLVQPISLDSFIGSLDDLMVSLDSPAFRGGNPVLLVYDDQHRVGTLSGPPLDAVLQDGVRELFPGQRARITAIRPLTDALSTVGIGKQGALSDTQVVETYAPRRGSGTYRTRESANLTQVTVTISSQDYTFVQGYDVDAVAGGRA